MVLKNNNKFVIKSDLVNILKIIQKSFKYFLWKMTSIKQNLQELNTNQWNLVRYWPVGSIQLATHCDCVWITLPDDHCYRNCWSTMKCAHRITEVNENDGVVESQRSDLLQALDRENRPSRCPYRTRKTLHGPTPWISRITNEDINQRRHNGAGQNGFWHCCSTQQRTARARYR